MFVISVILAWRDDGPVVAPPAAGELAAREGVFALLCSPSAGTLRRRCEGGALGSLGFRIRLGFSIPSSRLLLFLLILVPGLGPGFRRGRPSFVSKG